MSKRVLIVEDEIFVALDLGASLSEAGYDVIGIAADRASALEYAEQADVALVDLNLRDGPTGLGIGLTLTRDFGVQVLFLTANPSSVSDVDGVVGCLGKPCPPAAVCNAIEFATVGEGKKAPRELIRYQ